MLTTKLNQARKLGKDQGGFTLIELLIVIVILGVLAGIVVFSVKGITSRGDVAACKSEVSTVDTAEEAYYAQTGSYGALADLEGKFLHSTPTYVSAASATDGSLTMASGAPCTAE